MAERSGRRQKPDGRAGRRDPHARTPTATARHFYLDLFTAEERAALAGAAEGNDLEQEVRLLRVLIRRAVAEGTDLETVSRALGRLAQMMRVQRVLAGESAKSLDEALAKALEEIANEVGL